MELYEKPGNVEHSKNNEAFRYLVKRYQWANWHQPNVEKAPWHWQCLIEGEGPYPAIINVWPHVAKAQREGDKSVEGWDEIRMLITLAIEENGYSEVELVE